MFFKKKSYPDEPRKEPEVVWDEESLAHFTKQQRIDVQITSVTKRSGTRRRTHSGSVWI
jgi:hypothetical protein